MARNSPATIDSFMLVQKASVGDRNTSLDARLGQGPRDELHDEVGSTEGDRSPISVGTRLQMMRVRSSAEVLEERHLAFIDRRVLTTPR